MGLYLCAFSHSPIMHYFFTCILFHQRKWLIEDFSSLLKPFKFTTVTSIILDLASIILNLCFHKKEPKPEIITL